MTTETQIQDVPDTSLTEQLRCDRTEGATGGAAFDYTARNSVGYLSGPMRGLPDFNYPAFDLKTKELREDGYEIISPHELFGGRTDFPVEEYFRWDFLSILNDADYLVVLPGWKSSVGSILEVAVARALDYPIFDAHTREEIVFPPLAVWGGWLGVADRVDGTPVNSFPDEQSDPGDEDDHPELDLPDLHEGREEEYEDEEDENYYADEDPEDLCDFCGFPSADCYCDSWEPYDGPQDDEPEERVKTGPAKIGAGGHNFVPGESILHEAERLINGERQASYGHPGRDFNIICGFWNQYLTDHLVRPLKAEDVAYMMILMKVARAMENYKRDNLVDIAGYAGCVQKIHEEWNNTHPDHPDYLPF